MSKKSTVIINGDSVGDLDVLLAEAAKPIIITSATIKDEFCNYGYEINTGPTAGDQIPTRKGKSIVHEDMIEAFGALRVHLAILDDGFKDLPKAPKTLDDMKDHEMAGRFMITGFKISGSDENEGYTLIGEKWVSHGSIKLESPKIKENSKYDYFDDLQEAITNARYEVEQYMNGKAAPKLEQGSIDFPDQSDDTDFDNPM